MAQKAVIDLLPDVIQVCRQAPTSTLIAAYVRAARRLCSSARWLQASIAGATIAPTYSTGTVTVTNNSPNVSGVGTAWLTQAPAGSTFVSADGATYTVSSVTTDTALVLTANYAGATLAGQTYTVTRQNAIYSLGSDTYAEIIGLDGVTLYKTATEPVFLSESLSGEWDPTADKDTPEFYQYLPEGQVILHPTPDAAYNVTFGAVIIPKRGSTSIDDRLAARWEYVLQDGALSYLLAMPDVPWRDVPLAQVHEERFRSGIREASAEASVGFNAGATPLRTKPL